jgi:hypothetical protein
MATLLKVVIYYTSFIRHHFVARVFRANKCDKMAYKTSVTEYFSILPLFKILKKVQNIMLGRLYLANIKGWLHW